MPEYPTPQSPGEPDLDPAGEEQLTSGVAYVTGSGEAIPVGSATDMESKSGGTWRFLIDVAETVLIALVLFFALNTLTSRIRVESISMEATLFQGDFLLVFKPLYWLGEPQYGDVVVFDYPPDPSQQYIKRVIGLPGDEVLITDGKVFINGQELQEDYLKVVPVYTSRWTVPEDQIFVLGDNRNRSSDSHVWGPVPLENVHGRALFIYWPLERITILNDHPVFLSGE